MKVKGLAIKTIPIFIQKTFGEDGFKKWLDAIPPEAQKVYDSTILEGSWYPLKEMLVIPTKKICDIFYNGELRGAWDAGRFSANYGLKGIYEIFVKIGKPKFLIKRARAILPGYYKPSIIKVVELNKEKTVLRITEFPEMYNVIEHRIAGWMERAVEISGGKQVKIEITKSLTKGDSYSEFTGYWK